MKSSDLIWGWVVFVAIIVTAVYIGASDVLFRRITDPKDTGAINRNFEDVQNSLRILERRVLSESDTCELDVPDQRGFLCFDTTDFKLYVATATTTRGFQTIGSQ